MKRTSLAVVVYLNACMIGLYERKYKQTYFDKIWNSIKISSVGWAPGQTYIQPYSTVSHEHRPYRYHPRDNGRTQCFSYRVMLIQLKRGIDLGNPCQHNAEAFFPHCLSWHHTGVVHDDVMSWKRFPHYWPFIGVSLTNGSIKRSFGVFFVLGLNGILYRQSSGRWHVTPWHSCMVTVMRETVNNDYVRRYCICSVHTVLCFLMGCHCQVMLFIDLRVTLLLLGQS